MKDTYIATFYSHFGAMRYKKDCEKNGWSAQMMPVPRDLSSSCGTCVRFSGENVDPVSIIHDELEQIVRVEGPGNYVEIYRAEGA